MKNAIRRPILLLLAFLLTVAWVPISAASVQTEKGVVLNDLTDVPQGQVLSSELLVNPSFEEYSFSLVDNWQKRGEPHASLTVEKNVAGANGNCLKFVPGGNNGWNYVGVIGKDRNEMNLEANTVYVFSARFKRAGTGTPEAAICMRNAEGTPNKRLVLTDDNWTTLQLIYRGSAAATQCQFIAGIAEPQPQIGYGNSDPNLAVYIDDVSVKKYVNAPSSTFQKIDLSESKTLYGQGDSTGSIIVKGITESGKITIEPSSNLTFTSSDPRILSVDSTGTVTKNSTGLAVITASYTNPDGSKVSASIAVGSTNTNTISQNFNNDTFYNPDVDFQVLGVSNIGRAPEIGKVLKISKKPIGCLSTLPPWGFDLGGFLSTSQICEGWFYDNGTNVNANAALYFQSNAQNGGQTIPVTGRYQIGIDTSQDTAHYYFISNAGERNASCTGAGTIYTPMNGSNGVAKMERSKGWHQVTVVTLGKDADWFTDNGKVTIYFDGQQIFTENYVNPPIGCVRGNSYYDLPVGSYYDDFNIYEYSAFNRPPVVSNVVLSGCPMETNTLTVNCDISDIDGDEATPLYTWEESVDGLQWSVKEDSTSNTITIPVGYAGKYIRAKVTPRSQQAPHEGTPMYSDKILIQEYRTLPSASDLSLNGTGLIGETLSAYYTYTAGSLPEGDTKIIWERKRNGSNQWVQIPSAGSSSGTYTLGLADANCSIRVVVTPVDVSGLEGPSVITPTSITVGADMCYFVATDGNDQNGGSINHPFKNWIKARDVIAEQMKIISQYGEELQPGPINVYLRGGVYGYLWKLSLNANYSGTENNPIVYSNYQDEKVRITNGRILDYSTASKLENSSNATDLEIYNRIQDPLAKKRIMRINLGVTNLDALHDYGFGSMFNSSPNYPVELFINGMAQELARWPNKDEQLIEITEVTAGADGQPFTIKYKDDNAYTQKWSSYGRDNIFIGGSLGNDWAKVYHKLDLAKTNFAGKTIGSTGNTPYKPAVGKKFYFYNIPEEIDQPGEYYIDRVNGVAYFYPPFDVTATNQNVEMTLSYNPGNIIDMAGAHDIEINGFDFDTSRRSMIVGYNTVKNIKIQDCNFSGGAAKAIELEGTNCLISGCHIRDMGSGGISINGGDRKTLTPANNIVEFNKIHNFNRHYRSSTPGISVSGVKQTIKDNVIFDGTGTMIQLFGANDTLIERNEIYNAVTEESDIGAIYMGRKVHELGTVIRHNLFHDIGNTNGGYGQQSIFLDDGSAGAHIYNNIFAKATRTPSQGGTPSDDHAIKFNSAQYSLVENNIFVDAPSTISMLKMGPVENNQQIGWWLYHNSDNNVWEALENSGWGSQAWLAHYAGTQWDALSKSFTTNQHNELMGKTTDSQKKAVAKKYAPYITNTMKNNVLINVTEGGDGNVNQPINASGNVRIDETDGKHCFVNYGSIYQISSWGYSHIRSFIPDFPTLNTPSGAESTVGGTKPNVTGAVAQLTSAMENTVTACYSYTDPDNDPEGCSEIVWYQSDNANGNFIEIGKKGHELWIDESLKGKYVRFEVKPYDRTGLYGNVVTSPSILIPNV